MHQIHQFKLDRVCFTRSTLLDLDPLENTQLVLDEEIKRWVLRFRKDILSQALHKQIIRYPKNWIEAFKERWFPYWAKRKWPVQYTEWRADFSFLYPDLQKHSAIPNEDKIIYCSVSKVQRD